VLYPPEEQEYIARQISGGQFALLKSNYGHDAFLVEYEKLEEIIRPFLQD
jgi:homoserine O-acetyltransferase